MGVLEQSEGSGDINLPLRVAKGVSGRTWLFVSVKPSLIQGFLLCPQGHHSCRFNSTLSSRHLSELILFIILAALQTHHHFVLQKLCSTGHWMLSVFLLSLLLSLLLLFHLPSSPRPFHTAKPQDRLQISSLLSLHSFIMTSLSCLGEGVAGEERQRVIWDFVFVNILFNTGPVWKLW